MRQNTAKTTKPPTSQSVRKIGYLLCVRLLKQPIAAPCADAVFTARS